MLLALNSVPQPVTVHASTGRQCQTGFKRRVLKRVRRIEQPLPYRFVCQIIELLLKLIDQGLNRFAWKQIPGDQKAIVMELLDLLGGESSFSLVTPQLKNGLLNSFSSERIEPRFGQKPNPVVMGSRDALRILATAGHKAGYILTTCGQTNTAVARIDTPTDGIRRVGNRSVQ